MNYTPLTAIEITSILTPYDSEVDLSASPDDAVNVPDGAVNNPAKNSGWWKYTAQLGDDAIAITAAYRGVELDYVPINGIWIEDPDNPGQLTQAIEVDSTSINQITIRVIPSDFSSGVIGVWLVVPVVAGQTYYIQSANDSSPYVAPTATTVLSVRKAPHASVSGGSFLIPSDSKPYPAIAVSRVGSIRKVFPTVTATEIGDTLSTGEICCAGDDGFRVYSNQLALVATVIPPDDAFAGVVRAHSSGKWYATCRGSADEDLPFIITINPDGTMGPDTWTLSTEVLSSPQDLAISPDETIAYWVGSEGAGPADLTKIRRHDLTTDTPLSDFIDLGVGNNFSSKGDMACVESDGSVLVRDPVEFSTHATAIRRYSAAGALLHTYAIATAPDVIDRFRQEPDGITFWAWVHHDDDSLMSYLQQIRISDGAVLYTSPDFALDAEAGRGYEFDYPFAPSDSCPLLFLTVPIGDDNSIPVIYKTDIGTEDYDEEFQAFVKTRAIPPSGQITTLGDIAQPATLVAGSATDVEIQLDIDIDFEKQQSVSTVDLTPAGSETRVIREFDSAAAADVGAVQFRIGDAAPISNAWVLDYLHVPTSKDGAR